MPDETTTTNSESSSRQYFDISEETRQPVLINDRRYKPLSNAAPAPSRRRKQNQKQREEPISGTLETGDRYILYPGYESDLYTVEPLRLILKFNEVVSTFAPTNAPDIYEDETLCDILSDTRYRQRIDNSRKPMQYIFDEDTIKHVKNLPGMNTIEYYSQYPRHTHPALIYQILMIARCLYNTDREEYGMPVITNTDGKICKHTVQVIDIEESLINSASDIDFINLMYCDRRKMHHLIYTILNAAGYAGYSFTDTAYVSGVYTTKTDQPSHYDKPFVKYVQWIDKEVCSRKPYRAPEDFHTLESRRRNLSRNPTWK